MFTIYGPGFTDPIRLEKLLQRPSVAKLGAASATVAIHPSKMPMKKNIDLHGQLGSNTPAQTEWLSDSESPASKTLLKAGQIMMKPVVTVQPDTSLVEVWQMFEAYGFRHLPVLSDQHALVGIISDRDLIRCQCGGDHGCLHCKPNEFKGLVSDLMQREVITAHAETDARSIAKVLVESHIGALPVMGNQQLIGIVTRSDLLRAVIQDQHLNVWM